MGRRNIFLTLKERGLITSFIINKNRLKKGDAMISCRLDDKSKRTKKKFSNYYFKLFVVKLLTIFIHNRHVV